MIRRLAGLALVASLGLPALPGAAHPLTACAAGVHQASLVVRHQYNGALVRTYCVGFNSDEVTGEQLLDLAHHEYGVTFTVEAYGVCGPNQTQCDALCSLGNEAAPPGDPNEPAHYDACLAAGKPYWGIYVSRGGGPWAASRLGMSAQTFGDGDAEGFSYGAPGPPPRSPVGVCHPGTDGAAAGPAQPARGGSGTTAESLPSPPVAARGATGPAETGGYGSRAAAGLNNPSVPQRTSASLPSEHSTSPGVTSSTGPPSSGAVAGISTRAAPPRTLGPSLGAMSNSEGRSAEFSWGLLVLCVTGGALLGLVLLQFGRRVT